MLSVRMDARRAHARLDRLPAALKVALHSKLQKLPHRLQPHVLGGAVHQDLHGATAGAGAKTEALRQAGVRPASHDMLPDKHQALALAVAARDRLESAMQSGGPHRHLVDQLRRHALHAARAAMRR